jgi:hypothetical protein
MRRTSTDPTSISSPLHSTTRRISDSGRLRGQQRGIVFGLALASGDDVRGSTERRIAAGPAEHKRRHA